MVLILALLSMQQFWQRTVDLYTVICLENVSACIIIIIILHFYCIEVFFSGIQISHSQSTYFLCNLVSVHY